MNFSGCGTAKAVPLQINSTFKSTQPSNQLNLQINSTFKSNQLSNQPNRELDTSIAVKFAVLLLLPA
jgi:hypothetical protein